MILSYLFITHDINVIRFMSNRLGVLFYGRMVEVGRTYDLVTAPKHPYSEELLTNLPTVNKKLHIADGAANEHRPAESGCVYRNACARAFAKCATQEPSLREIEPDRSVACFLYDDVKS